MAHAVAMARIEGWPRCYYWNAVWWRLHAKESAVPEQAAQWSRNQISLYRDCVANPGRYSSGARPEMTDWQKFQAAQRGEEES